MTYVLRNIYQMLLKVLWNVYAGLMSAIIFVAVGLFFLIFGVPGGFGITFKLLTGYCFRSFVDGRCL